MSLFTAYDMKAIAKGYSERVGEHFVWDMIQEAAKKGKTSVLMLTVFELEKAEHVKEYIFFRDYVFPVLEMQGFKLSHSKSREICIDDQTELLEVITTIDWSEPYEN